MEVSPWLGLAQHTQNAGGPQQVGQPWSRLNRTETEADGSRIQKVNGEEISTGTHNETIEIFRGEEGHVVVQVLPKNACSRRSRDVATQTDLSGDTASRSTSFCDGYFFLHGTTADLHCNPSAHYPNTAPRVENGYHHQAEEEKAANTGNLCDAPDLQDQDSGLGCVNGGRQNVGSEQDATGEEGICGRCEDLGQLMIDELCLGDSINSDECSDSGFYSISHKECERFQKVLERKSQLYTSRNESELGRKTLTEVETKSKWGNDPKTKPRRSQEGDGLQKHRSGEASDLTERVTVQGQQKSLQIWPATNESSRSENRSNSPHHYTTYPPEGGPGITLCGPARGVSRRGAGRTGNSGPAGGEPQRAGRDCSVHIPQRAQHYQSYMQLVQQRTAVECGTSLSEDDMDTAGTCAIAKKQLKEQLLKERAMKIGEERAGLTTDDDSLSEMKMGRYWNRTERRQHWAQARERRQRKEMMVQSRLEIVNESTQTVGNGRAKCSVIELSQRIANRKRSKKIFDNWVTIQELLAHGSPAADGTMVYSPLLSVTTV